MEELLDLLVKMNDDKKKVIEDGRENFTNEEIKKYKTKYVQILASWGEDLNSRISKSKNPKIFDDEKNLHDRLVEYDKEHLLFIHNFEVPFDNNFGERAIRMVKSKINVCGGFRTIDGLNRFAKIKSFIMTSKYREENVLSNLVTLLSGEEYKLT